MSSFTYRRPRLYPAQERAIFTPARYAVIEASTKAGKTFGCMAWLTERAMGGGRGHNYWWVSPVLAQAKIVYRRLKMALPLAVYTSNDTEQAITLANGAVIWFKGGDKPDSLYGEDVYDAVIDEASRCKEEAFIAVRSTLTATGGHLRIIGNVRGKRNWAYRLARRAEAGDPAMHYARITAADAVAGGVLDAAEIEDARRLLSAAVAGELYDAVAADDGSNPFGLAAIAACVDGPGEGPAAAWGWDLARKRDWTAGLALAGDGRWCAYERWQHVPWEETIARIRRHTAGRPALVDGSGVGDPVLEALQRAGGGQYEGLVFTERSRQQLLEGLALALGERAVTIPAAVAAELEAFEFEHSRTGVRYAAPEGCTDDGAMAAALAVKRLRSGGVPAADAGRDPEPVPRRRQPLFARR